MTRKSPRLDQFADHLADGKSPREAAKAMGLSADFGGGMLAALRRKLGEQAK